MFLSPHSGFAYLLYILDLLFKKVVAEKSQFYFIPIPKYYKTPSTSKHTYLCIFPAEPFF